MFTHKTLQITPHGILTAAMLNELYRLPQDYLRLRYADYGSGIVAGLGINSSHGDIVFSPGMVKKGDEFYFSYTDFSLRSLIQAAELVPDGRRYAVMLGPAEGENCRGVSVQKLQERLLPLTDWQKALSVDGTICLGEFAYNSADDPELPPMTNSPDDFVTAFTGAAYYRLMPIPWATAGGSTLHPYILAAVKNILTVKIPDGLTSADTMLLMQLTERQVVNLDTLVTYIRLNGVPIDDAPLREEIVQKLAVAMKAKPPRYSLDDGQKESPPIIRRRKGLESIVVPYDS